MHGGRSIKASTAALTLLAGLATGAGHGQAADLGGDCCADLEERIAELEATTARKGNRKVSLEIYGQVNEEILWWDDGFESNAGIYTNDNSRTRVGFRGKAKINGDWEAGYRLEIGVRSANSKRFTQNDPTPTALNSFGLSEVGLDIRDSHWYFKSKQLGTASVGRQATATDGITEINQTQTADFSKFSDVEDTGLGLFLRQTNGVLSNINTRRLIGEGGDQPGEGERRFDGVRYVSPEFGGFTVSAFWGQDDFWDLAIRYKGDFAGFTVAAGIGYGEITDGSQTNTTAGSGPRNPAELATSPLDAQQFGGSISIIHQDTGLFVNAGAGEKTDEGLSQLAIYQGAGANNLDDTDSFWALQAGIEKKWISLGKTTIYGEYYDYTGGSLNRRFAANGVSSTSFPNGSTAVVNSGLELYGFGIAQGVDAAAMTLYLTYRHVDPQVTGATIIGGEAAGLARDIAVEDFDFVQAGGIIKF